MEIERVSPISKKKHIMDIAVTQEQIDAWKSGTLIQKAMPNISREEREFIKTGITIEEWSTLFKNTE